MSYRPGPAAARSPAEFVDAMRQLKEWTGLGYRQLARRATAAGDFLPRSTITAALTRDSLPREDLVAVFARTCGCTEDEVEQWVSTRRRIAAGVVPTDRSPGPTQLPPPVAGFAGRTRELDELHAAAGRNSVVVLAGTAGVGKPRSGI